MRGFDSLARIQCIELIEAFRHACQVVMHLDLIVNNPHLDCRACVVAESNLDRRGSFPCSTSDAYVRLVTVLNEKSISIADA